MVRARGEEFDGYFTGWTYSAPRALGWISDPSLKAYIASDPLAIRIIIVLNQLRADGLLPVGPRGVGYVLLGRIVDGRKVVKEKKKIETPGMTKSERNAYLAGFYDFQDIGDTLVALRRAGLVRMTDILDGRTESHNPLVAINANDVRKTAERVAKRFGPDVLNDQTVYCEWWCEAQGLARAVANILTPYGLSVFSGSGDNPLPAVAACADRLQEALQDDKEVVVCIIGDRDIDGLGNADRFRQDVEAMLEEDGYEDEVEWRWVAPTPDHVVRWPDLAAAQEAGKRQGDKVLGWTMQGEALLRGGVLAIIVREEVEDILDMDQYWATQLVWTATHGAVVNQHTGTAWEVTERDAEAIAEHLTNVLIAAWWTPETLSTPPD